MEETNYQMKIGGEDSCVVLGGGGHAQVLIDSIFSMGGIKLFGILDPDPRLLGSKILGVPVMGSDAMLPELVDQGVRFFAVGLGSIGDSHPRQRLFQLGVQAKLTPLTVIHKSAILSRWAQLGAGCQLFPASILNAGVVLGVNVIVNSGAIVEHDCQVGDHAHIATGARLASTVRVGQGAHVGAGATVLQNRSIGENAIVGAGAVVVENVPASCVVVGVPAKIIRRL